MDIKVAAQLTLDHASMIKINDMFPEDHPAYGKLHLFDMLDAIIDGTIGGEKAHRWLGWVQAIMCVQGAATLEQLKDINHKA